jgi:Ca2+-binding RTX toxin-like protein
MSRQKPGSFVPQLSQLESREVPSIASIQSAGGVLRVNCIGTSTVVVSQSNGTITVQDIVLNKTFSYSAAGVNRVDVFGGAGNDTLTSRLTTVPARLMGGAGNDTLLSGNGTTTLNGGVGNDTIKGGNGTNRILGGDGNDTILGGNGTNVIDAGTGNNYVKGGLGTNNISADGGNNTIVTINAQGNDVIDPGLGTNIIWMDPSDHVLAPTTRDTINAVSSWSNPGADMTLNGDRIPDPLPTREDPNNPGVIISDQYQTITGQPLFSSQGPSYKDISQGQLGDCWLLCGFGTIANSNPNLIRQHVVDFMDGTYGVKLGNSFYRVDNDLPVAVSGDAHLQYTAFGVQNSLWVAILEKAYTYYRTANQGTYGNISPPNSYGRIEGGFTYDMFSSFGLKANRLWFGQAAPSPTYGKNTTMQQLSNTIRTIVDNHLPGAVEFQSTPTGSILIPAHQYILLDYTIDPASGLVSTVTLRNPWGIDGPYATPVLGNDSNFYDGVVTVPVSYVDTVGHVQPGLLMDCWAGLEWGTPT